MHRRTGLRFLVTRTAVRGAREAHTPAFGDPSPTAWSMGTSTGNCGGYASPSTSNVRGVFVDMTCFTHRAAGNDAGGGTAA